MFTWGIDLWQNVNAQMFWTYWINTVFFYVCRCYSTCIALWVVQSHLSLLSSSYIFWMWEMLGSCISILASNSNTGTVIENLELSMCSECGQETSVHIWSNLVSPYLRFWFWSVVSVTYWFVFSLNLTSPHLSEFICLFSPVIVNFVWFSLLRYFMIQIVDGYFRNWII